MGDSTPMTIAEVAHQTRHKRGAVGRWVHHGLQVGGRVVRLAAERVGGRLYITADALAEFRRACNADLTTPTETPTARQTRAAAAVARARKLVAGR